MPQPLNGHLKGGGVAPRAKGLKRDIAPHVAARYRDAMSLFMDFSHRRER